MNQREVSQVLTALKAVWTTHPITEDTVAVYAASLEDVTGEQGKWAALTWVRTGKFFPTPAELRTLIAERLLRLAPAEDAWLEVKRAVRDVGSYGAPCWSSPILARAMEAIGYREFCMSEMADEPAWRAQFVRFYEAYRDRALRERTVGGFGAITEASAERLTEGKS